jgi:hypothetical protein
MTDDKLIQTIKENLWFLTEQDPLYKGKEIIEERLKHFGFTLLDSKQVYYRDWDHNGSLINGRELPFVNQLWKR